MRRVLFLLLLPLLASAGCSCLTGSGAYRPVPIPTLRSRVAVTSTSSAHAAGLQALENRSSEWIQSQAEYRSPDKAFCLACLVAGGGHLYTGETVKGVALMGVAAGSLITGAVLSSSGDDYGDCEYNPATFECEPAGGSTPLLIGAGIAAGSWIYGIIDSRASADRVNERNGHRVGAAAIETRPWLGMSHGRPTGGLNVRVTF